MPSLAAREPYTRSFEAAVTRIEDTAVVLDTTYFYPEGGGQPPDRGRIGDIEVCDVQERNGDIVHTLGTRPDWSVGETVEARIDEEFRTYCMRAHTASHVLYGAGRQCLDELGYGGFDIGPEKVRVDLATPTHITDDTLIELERLSNRVVWDSHSVSWEIQSSEDALESSTIAFNTATAEGIEGDSVRIVTIEEWDVAACGGTHVRNTREIGPITVLDRSNPGEGLTRVEFAVGPTAIERQSTIHEQAMTAARHLDTGVAHLVPAIERQADEFASVRAELESLREQLVSARLAELRDEVHDREGDRWLVGALPGLDANDLAEQARELVGDDIDVAALMDDEGQYVAVASACAVDADAVIASVTEAFGGGGGGSQTVAQGGGLDASVEELVSTLREG